EDIKAAEPTGRGCDRRLPIPLPRYVEMREDGGGAGSYQSLHGVAAALVEHIADDDFGPGLGHQPCGFGAYAARRPGKQPDLAVEAVHGSLLPKKQNRTFSRRASHAAVYRFPIG